MSELGETLMGEAGSKAERRTRERDALARCAPVPAFSKPARRVARREGARDLSLRGVAAEAGFAPAGLYGYFRNKDELLLALAADDLTALARAMRDAHGFAGPGGAALDHLSSDRRVHGGGVSPPLSAAPQSAGGGGDAERLFNGRLIAALRAPF